MKKISLAIFCLFFGLVMHAQPVVGFTDFITGLTTPVDIVNAGDGSNRLFIVQQNGQVKIYQAGALLATPFLDMGSVITNDGEQGLLSIAFHPQYSTNGFFFVYYNNTAGAVELAQYHVSATDGNVADPTSRRVLITIPKPFTNHNGGRLQFGPDGLLYVGTGDGGSGGDPNNYAQNLGSLLGKMIRINVDDFNTSPYYTIPASNPFKSVVGARPEIYQLGLRNPFRWSFDTQTGDMWIADVGQGAREEVNMIPAASTSGLNFGWRCYEGTLNYNLSACGTSPLVGKTFPIYEYDHSTAGGLSITGGEVYRGTTYAALQGWYICSDYIYSNGRLIKPNGAGGYTVSVQNDFPLHLSAFGHGEDGTLYAVNRDGKILTVVVNAVLPVQLLSFSATTSSQKDLLNWEATSDESLKEFTIEHSADGLRFSAIGAVAPQGPAVFKYTFVGHEDVSITRYYRLKMTYKNGNATFSDIVKLSPAAPTEKASLLLSTSGNIIMNLPYKSEKILLLNATGQVMQQFAARNAGTSVLYPKTGAHGIYFLRIFNTNRQVETLKFVR